AVAGAIALAVVGLHAAFERNVGGLGDTAHATWATVSLALSGLQQLFEQGGFSGAVRIELNRAENLGLKGFVVNLFLLANRVRAFFAGIGAGWSAGVDAARPTLAAFSRALDALGSAFIFLGDRDDAKTASAKFSSFGTSGAAVGRALAHVFELVVKGMTALVHVGRGLVEGWGAIEPGLSIVWRAFTRVLSIVGDTIGMLARATGLTEASGDAWATFGTLVSVAIGVALFAFGLFMGVVQLLAAVASAVVGVVTSLFSGLADVITGVVFIIGGIVDGDWKAVWTGMKLIVFGVIDAIIGVVLELVGAIGGAVDAMAGMVGESTDIQKAVRDYKDSVHRDLATTFGVESQTFTPIGARPPAPAGTAGVATTPMPAAAAIATLPPVVITAEPRVATLPPTIINLQVDGQTVAKAVHKADSEVAARSFSPLPAY
ncbi:MAG: phage tail tape measure protein, partial [Polyangiales bacterium]